MRPHDDSFLDSVAALALGTLPETEARDVVRHATACAICSREYASLRAAADAIGFAAELAPTAMDELSARRLKARVMTAVVESVPETHNGVRTTQPLDSRASAGGDASRRGRSVWLPYGIAAAAALVAAVSLANNATLRGDRASDASRIASLESSASDARSQANAARAQLVTLDARVAKIVAPGSRHFSVNAGEVVASGNRVILALRNLPKLPAGKTYQAWTLARGAKAVAPSVTFATDATGVALVELPEDAAHLAAVAVSVEPTGGSKAPTSKPTFVRALT
ncbi:MAG: anti-sigma factor [Vulcanimicrobiaceae bacterium]